MVEHKAGEVLPRLGLPFIPELPEVPWESSMKVIYPTTAYYIP